MKMPRKPDKPGAPSYGMTSRPGGYPAKGKRRPSLEFYDAIAYDPRRRK
jgi:hypothetical protein